MSLYPSEVCLFPTQKKLLLFLRNRFSETSGPYNLTIPPKKRLRLARAFYSFALALFPGKIADSVGLAPLHDISLDKVDLLSGIAVIDLRIGDLVNLSIGQLFASFRVIQNRLFE